MDRLFYAAMLSALLMLAPARVAAGETLCAQPVLFSMLFEQLIPQAQARSVMDMTPGEAVML